MADLATVESALLKADAAGDTEGARVLAGEVRRLRASEGPARHAAIEANLDRVVARHKAERDAEPGVFRKTLQGVGAALSPLGMVTEPVQEALYGDVSVEGGGTLAEGLGRRGQMERAGKIGERLEKGFKKGATRAVGTIAETIAPKGSVLQQAGTATREAAGETATERISRAMVNEGVNPRAAAIIALGMEMATDPTNLIPAGAGGKLAGKVERVIKGSAAKKELAAVERLMADKVTRDAARAAEVEGARSMDASRLKEAQELRRYQTEVLPGQLEAERQAARSAAAEREAARLRETPYAQRMSPAEEAEYRASVAREEREGAASRATREAEIAAEREAAETAALERRLGPEAAEAERLSYQRATGPEGKPLPKVKTEGPTHPSTRVEGGELAMEEARQAAESGVTVPLVKTEYLSGAQVPSLGSAVQTLKGTGKAVAEGVARITESGPGRKLSPGIRGLVSRAEDYIAFKGRGQWLRTHEDAAEGLSKGDVRWLRDNMYKVFEEGLKPTTPAQANFIRTWRDVVAPDVLKEAQGVGLGTQSRAGYFPRRLTDEAREALIAEQGDLYKALVKEAEAKGIDPAGFSEWAQNEMWTKKAGSLEFHRALDIKREINVDGRMVKVFETDPFKIIPQYIDSASRRIGLSKALGSTDVAEAAGALSKGMKAPERQAFEDVLKTLQRQPHIDPFTRSAMPGGTLRYPAAIYKGARDVASVGFLSGAQLSNMIGGIVPIATKAGMGRALKNYAKVLAGGGKESIELAERMGAIHGKIGLESYAATEHLGGWARKALEGTGLAKANQIISRVAAVSAKELVDQAVTLAKSGDKALLDDLARQFDWGADDVARMVKDGVTDEDYGRALRLFVSRTNPSMESALDVPRIMTHPIARDVFAYTTYTRALGNVTAYAARQAQNGNLLPAVVLIGGGVASQDAIKRTKDLIRGRKQEDIETGLLKAAMSSGLGGMPQDIAVDMAFSIKRGKPPSFASPTMEEAFAVGGDLIRGKPGQAAEEIRRRNFLVDVVARLGGADPLKAKGDKPKGRRPRKPRRRRGGD